MSVMIFFPRSVVEISLEFDASARSVDTIIEFVLDGNHHNITWLIDLIFPPFPAAVFRESSCHC